MNYYRNMKQAKNDFDIGDDIFLYLKYKMIGCSRY